MKIQSEFIISTGIIGNVEDSAEAGNHRLAELLRTIRVRILLLKNSVENLSSY